jgi:hypothetical protein
VAPARPPFFFFFFWARLRGGAPTSYFSGHGTDVKGAQRAAWLQSCSVDGWLHPVATHVLPSLPTPREHSPKSGQQRQQCPGGRGKAVVLVGFIGKLGVLDRAFAKFLCDEQKALKDRRWELCSRFIIIDLMKEASFF